MRRLAQVLTLIAALAAACNEEVAPPASCDSTVLADGGTIPDGGLFTNFAVIEDGAAVADPDRATQLVVPIKVQIDMPCLRAGVHALLTTSAGTIGGNNPGTPLP